MYTSSFASGLAKLTAIKPPTSSRDGNELKLFWHTIPVLKLAPKSAEME